jgi:hypothetical protein
MLMFTRSSPAAFKSLASGASSVPWWLSKLPQAPGCASLGDEIHDPPPDQRFSAVRRTFFKPNPQRNAPAAKSPQSARFPSAAWVPPGFRHAVYAAQVAFIGDGYRNYAISGNTCLAANNSSEELLCDQAGYAHGVVQPEHRHPISNGTSLIPPPVHPADRAAGMAGCRPEHLDLRLVPRL